MGRHFSFILIMLGIMESYMDFLPSHFFGCWGGVSATAYKLTAILYYAVYVWTTYLLAKHINKKVAFIVLLLMLVPSPSMSFNATHNFKNAIIIGLGNLSKLKVLIIFSYWMCWNIWKIQRSLYIT